MINVASVNMEMAMSLTDAKELLEIRPCFAGHRAANLMLTMSHIVNMKNLYMFCLFCFFIIEGCFLYFLLEGCSPDMTSIIHVRFNWVMTQVGQRLSGITAF